MKAVQEGRAQRGAGKTERTGNRVVDAVNKESRMRSFDREMMRQRERWAGAKRVGK